MTCPRCGFALIRYLGHDTCSLGCGFDGERREPTAEERGRRGKHRTAAQLLSNPAPPRALRRNVA